MKGPAISQGVILTKKRKSLGKGDSNLVKWRTPPFSKGRLLRNSKNTSTNVAVARTTVPISTKLSTKILGWWGFKFVQKKGPHFSKGGGGNYEIAKINCWNLNIFSRTTGPISTKLSTKHPRLKGIQVFFKWRARPFQRGGGGGKNGKKKVKK